LELREVSRGRERLNSTAASPTVPGHQTAEQYVYTFLREQILAGRLQGGERVNQDEVAQQLHVSRMPVREAIRRLDSEGLLVNRPNRGALVTALGPEAILEAFEMRSVLEGLAVSLAVPMMDHTVMAEIDKRLLRLERQRHLTAWIQRHEEFHDYICTLAGRPRLMTTIRNLRQSVVPYIRLHVTTSGDGSPTDIPGFEHRALVEVLKRRDPEATEKAMREHILAASRGVVEFVRRTQQRT
jgi:DNA-binding GntR family transcriptional regulator